MKRAKRRQARIIVVKRLIVNSKKGKNKKMDGTLARILDLMQKQKIPETEMQDIIGVPRGSFSNWKRNKGHSYYKFIDQFADRLGVTIDYLIRGHETVCGSMTKGEVDLLNDYRRLTPEGKTIISANIRLIVGRHDC